MRTRILSVGFLCLSLAACSKKEEPAKPPPASAPTQAQAQEEVDLNRDPSKATGWQKKALEGQELFVTIDTNQGAMVARLFSKDAPKTVANFVGLASGEQPWRDPRTGEAVKGKPLYNGVTFHRVIPGFMIQGGDPTGTGRGSPGYRFEDEFQSGRTFDKPGLLAMANAGPRTNGSQFFITVSAPAYLNGRHTIFGEVLKGYEVAEKISNLPRDASDKPAEPVVINSITVSDTQP